MGCGAAIASEHYSYITTRVSGACHARSEIHAPPGWTPDDLVHLHRSACAFSWERHAPAWLPGPGWCPAFPGTKALAQEVLRKCTRSLPRGISRLYLIVLENIVLIVLQDIVLF